MAPCGLPVRSAAFTTSGSTTFEMTSDCRYSASAIHTSGISANTFLDFNGGGPYTINGNGYSIIGPPGARAINIVFGVTVNLNNVAIRSSGDDQAPVIQVNNGTLNATNVTFQDNTALAVITAEGGARINLTNAKFLGNRVQQGVIRSVNHQSNAVSINGAEFQNNRIAGDDILDIQTGSLTLEGRLGFRANPSALLGGQANYYTVGIGTFTDNGAVIYVIKLPKKKKADPTSAPTSTPRPQIAATHVALQAATGATFRTTFGLDSGVHFRQLDGAGIGVQSIIDAGYLEAFDVWGYVEQGVEVCFPQIGRVVFLDARTSPRAIVPLASTAVNGQTCVSIDSPGSLVLLPN